MPEDRIRQRAETFTHADAVVVEEYDDYTEVRLLYHPPEIEYKQQKTLMGMAVVGIQTEKMLDPKDARIKMEEIFDPDVFGMMEKEYCYEIVMLFK